MNVGGLFFNAKTSSGVFRDLSSLSVDPSALFPLCCASAPGPESIFFLQGQPNCQNLPRGLCLVDCINRRGGGSQLCPIKGRKKEEAERTFSLY